MMIKAVVFDIGNVLVNWVPERPFDRLLGQTRRKELFARVDFASMNERSDLGEDMWDLVRELADQHPEDRDDILLWSEHWLEMLAPDLPQTARLLRALRAKGMPVFALSNFGVGTLKLAEQRYPVLTEFDRRFVSGELRLAKPDPAIYAHLEAATGVDAEGLFFIDDRAENIDAAQARGWQGHLFETSEGLAKRLVAEGLLTVQEAA